MKIKMSSRKFYSKLLPWWEYDECDEHGNHRRKLKHAHRKLYRKRIVKIFGLEK